jgi:hypothetical protein
MIIESLVAILLMLTIGYCMLLNRRLKLLKSDEQSLWATIAELVTATEIAERAVAGLKLTAEECEAGLGARLTRAEHFTAELDRSIAVGKDVLGRLSQIVAADSGAVGAVGTAVAAAVAARRQNGTNAPPHDPQAVAAAAQAFAEKLRMKVHGLAA